MANEFSFVEVNLQDNRHVDAFIHLMDLYMQHPMGLGKSLPKDLAIKIVEGIRERPNYLGFFVELNGQMVALANCFENYSTFKAKPLINIHDFIVDEKFRRKGVGQFLLTELCNVAQMRGCCRVNLEVRTDNVAAMKLYEQMKFNNCQPSMLVFERAVSQ